VLGSLLPWVSVLGITKSGIEGDGQITFVLALVGGALVVIGRPHRGFSIVQGILAGLVSLVALYDMNGFAAIGLYVTLLAGLGLALCIPWQRLSAADRRQQPGAAAADPPAPPVAVEPTSE
jgi:hypothetical protein